MSGGSCFVIRIKKTENARTGLFSIVIKRQS